MPAKDLAQKGKKFKGRKKSKQRITVAFFVSADEGKVGKANNNIMKQKAKMFSIS